MVSEIVFATLAAIGLVLALHYRAKLKAQIAGLHPDIKAEAVKVFTPPAGEAPPPAKPAPKADTMTIHLVSPKGAPLGTQKILRSHRRPSMQFRVKDGRLGNFVAQSYAPGQTTVYRLVDSDRES